MCSICLSEQYDCVGETECNVTTLACGHKFHLSCLLQCLSVGDQRCPLCRRVYFQPSRGGGVIMGTGQRRREEVVNLIRLSLYAYCLYRTWAHYGESLTLSHIKETYAPWSLGSGGNLSHVQQSIATDRERYGRGLMGLLNLFFNLFIDLALIDLQVGLYRTCLTLILLARLVHFFIPLF